MQFREVRSRSSSRTSSGSIGSLDDDDDNINTVGGNPQRVPVVELEGYGYQELEREVVGWR